MSRLFDPGNPPRAGVAGRLWRKFVKEYGYEPDWLLVIAPGLRQRQEGAASWAIGSDRAIGGAGEILIQSGILPGDWTVPFADVLGGTGSVAFASGTSQFWWGGFGR